MFHVPTVELRDPRELLAYAVLGVIGGFFAVIFSTTLGYLRPRLRNLPRWTLICQPALAGLLVGSIGFFGFPQVMGVGYGVIDQAMHAQFTWQVLLALAILKLIATTVSFSSGTPGGMFAPTLFIGAMLGGAVGTFEKLFFPHLTGSVGAYALVGMGVLFAGFLRAPLTSVFMVLEVSGNYSIILPVILANTIAYLISRSLQPVPIFEVFTHQDGLNLPSMEEQREEVHLHIEDALRPVDIPILQGSDSLAKASQTFASAGVDTLLIRMWDKSWYALTRDELTGIQALQQPEAHLEIAVRKDRIPELYPDLTLDSALPCFARWKILPIQNRATHGTLEGILTELDVLNRYHEG
jgi:CIC family chloride channel protein